MRLLHGLPPTGSYSRLLSVKRCNLESIPEEAVRSARSLKEIYLEENRIHDLPKSFFRLTNLEKVSLECNDLVKINGDFGNFGKLLELNLARNSLQYIPESISCCAKLQVAEFSHNNIPRLPDGICMLHSLHTLKVGCSFY